MIPQKRCCDPGEGPEGLIKLQELHYHQKHPTPFLTPSGNEETSQGMSQVAPWPQLDCPDMAPGLVRDRQNGDVDLRVQLGLIPFYVSDIYPRGA